ncbi:hypothetical protein [Nitrospirillum iridis]|uniref:Uncharacterized protein n=1 Tax=Nitrospirillum iridis TaxID=765888 RepID=A0A7X0B3S8_9PROT|nr:hypothetical protein [Nitrospirillum iridis]MBB6255199.1 hypothetical protein [Nitrospirillum iridis]
MGDILIEPAQNAPSGARQHPTLAPSPFNKPRMVDNELRYVADAVANPHTSGNRPFTHRGEALPQRRVAEAGAP